MKKQCLHCLLEVQNADDDFCCLGCKTAYKIINNLGFSSYYDLRQIDEKERKIRPKEDEEVDISEFVKIENNKKSITLMVQGLHCAACVWLIESILKKQKSVNLARVNLSQKTLTIIWEGEVAYGNHLAHLISQIGYKLLPFDVEILQKAEKKYDDKILRAMAVAGFGAGNIMLLSISLWFSDSLDMGPITHNLLQFFSCLIAIPVLLFSSRPFFSSAYRAIKAGYPNMDLPISLAIVLASAVSILQMLKNANHIYFDSVVMLIFFLLIGRYLDLKARKKAFEIASEFTLLSASFGRILLDEKIVTLPIKKIEKDMILLVAAGEKIAADGVVIEGESEVDNSMINGESLPQKLVKNSAVFAGTINITMPLKIRVSKAQDESLMAKILEFVQIALSKKNSYVRLADNLSKFYTPAIHILALLTFIFWFADGFEIALMNATAVLIITCPCALALAVPIVQTITISRFIKRGILIKSGEALEKISKIDIIIFDKTGSLTLGKPQLKAIKFLDGRELSAEQKNYYLQIAASLSARSRHIISRAISNSYMGNILLLDAKEERGFGLSAWFEGKELRLGKKDFCLIKNNFSAEILENNLLNCFLKIGDEELILLFEDKLKEDAFAVISALKKQNKKIILLSGDLENTTARIASNLKIDEFYFEKTPLEKAEFLQNLKVQNKKFIMVGDGINDAPSLALADVSISFSSASDIAQNIADIVICNEKLQPILQLKKDSQKSLQLMKQNLIIALIYNIVALPFAFLGHVTPLFAALAMSSSSLLVLFNSLRMSKSK